MVRKENVVGRLIRCLMNKLESVYTEKLEKLIAQKLSDTKNPIFVFLGISDYVDMGSFISHVIDPETFAMNGNNKLWELYTCCPSK